MKDNYEKLPEVVEISGTGIPNLTAKCIKRTNTKALYYRWDNIWEVFRIKIKEEQTVFGKEYPKREAYPSNEDFGATAWAYPKEVDAMLMYANL